MGRCTIRIKAPLKDSQMIEMRIRRMQVGVLKESRCEGAYVQFSDELDEPDESVGRYCGHVTGNATRLFLRRGPELTVLLDSDNRDEEDEIIIGQEPQLKPQPITPRPKLKGRQRRRTKSRPRDSEPSPNADNDKPMRFGGGGGDRENRSSKTRHRAVSGRQHQGKIGLFSNQDIVEEDETKMLPHHRIDEEKLVNVEELSKTKKALRGDRLFWSKSRCDVENDCKQV
ncbi:hypothetical protein QAD02_018165 [Eretmocerus hayati]|uniref:Uncharacterized protein n=1 Tax=Eretmocerus hayati TaxID=131215 RepID=A0ACC2PFZ1_9HYME|nr:hypothetical protein QAD02_018165 [Eretmocerus hayati]